MAAGLGHRFGLVETPGFFRSWALSRLLRWPRCCWFAARASSSSGPMATAAAATAARRSPRRAAGAVAVRRLGLARSYAFPTLTDISTDADDPPALAAAARAAHRRHEPDRADHGRSRRTLQRGYLSGRHRAALSAPGRPGRGSGRGASSTTAAGGSSVPPAAADGDATSRSRRWPVPPSWRFPSDVSIRMTDEGESTYVDMRSASRYGRHDLGDNAARIAGFPGRARRRGRLCCGVTPAEPAPPRRRSCRRPRRRRPRPTEPAEPLRPV